MVPATLPLPQQNPSSHYETEFPSGTASTPATSSIASPSSPGKSGTQTAQPPMYGMDNQRPVAVRIVLLCTSLPPPSV
jgi:hypothetical protein